MFARVVAGAVLLGTLCGCAATPQSTPASSLGAGVADARPSAFALNDALCRLAASLQDADQQDEEAMLLLATGSLPLIPDGYMHSLYYDPENATYWIRAIGGISGLQTHWRGPAAVDHPRVREALEVVALRRAPDLRPPSSSGPASVSFLHSVEGRH